MSQNLQMQQLSLEQIWKPTNQEGVLWRIKDDGVRELFHEPCRMAMNNRGPGFDCCPSCIKVFRGVEPA